MSGDFAVFDCETTGFSPKSDCLTEIGWMVCRNGVPGPPASLLILPTVPVPDEVAALTGITTALLEAEGVPLEEALLTFIGDVAGLPLVGHNNVRFDVPFLEAACRASNIAPPERVRYVDTAALYKARQLHQRCPEEQAAHWRFAERVLAQRTPGLKYNLGYCCDVFGIDRSDVTAHRAGADVVLTARLYAALLSEREVVAV